MRVWLITATIVVIPTSALAQAEGEVTWWTTADYLNIAVPFFGAFLGFFGGTFVNDWLYRRRERDDRKQKAKVLAVALRGEVLAAANAFTRRRNNLRRRAERGEEGPPESKLEGMPEENSEDSAEDSPDYSPEAGSEDSSEDVPEDSAEDVPEDSAEDGPEDGPKDGSEDGYKDLYFQPAITKRIYTAYIDHIGLLDDPKLIADITQFFSVTSNERDFRKVKVDAYYAYCKMAARYNETARRRAMSISRKLRERAEEIV